jgi:hypothetical protein
MTHQPIMIMLMSILIVFRVIYLRKYHLSVHLYRSCRFLCLLQNPSHPFLVCAKSQRQPLIRHSLYASAPLTVSYFHHLFTIDSLPCCGATTIKCFKIFCRRIAAKYSRETFIPILSFYAEESDFYRSIVYLPLFWTFTTVNNPNT